MNEKFVERLKSEIEEIRTSGLYKTERIIASPQGMDDKFAEVVDRKAPPTKNGFVADT